MKLLKILILTALAIVVASCAKKATEAMADGIADILLPSDVSPVDAAAVGTPTDATGLSLDVTAP